MVPGLRPSCPTNLPLRERRVTEPEKCALCEERPRRANGVFCVPCHKQDVFNTAIQRLFRGFAWLLGIACAIKYLAS